MPTKNVPKPEGHDWKNIVTMLRNQRCPENDNRSRARCKVCLAAALALAYELGQSEKSNRKRRAVAA